MARGHLELKFTGPQEGRGPDVGYSHLPRVTADVQAWPEVTAAGLFAPMGWRPQEGACALWAVEAAEQPQAPLEATAQGMWLRPEDAALGHAQGVLVLSPLAWTVVCALILAAGAAAATQGEQIVRHAAQLLRDQCAAQAAGRGLGLGLGAHIAALPLLSPTLPPASHTNCYILGHKRLTLVDPGTPYPHEQQLLHDSLRQRVRAGATIEAVWITHHHADHVGAAAMVRHAFGARVLAHEATRADLAGRVPTDGSIEDGAVLQVEDDTFTALHTPGHAPGHLCFYAQRGGHLLSGDNVLGTGTPIVPPTPHGDMSAYIISLKRMGARPLGMLLPGHGPPQAHAARRIAETLTARLQREALLIEALAQMDGPQTVAALVGKVYRGLGPSLRGLAELSTLSHLEKLVHDGRAQAVAQGTATAWRLTIV